MPAPPRMLLLLISTSLMVQGEVKLFIVSVFRLYVAFDYVFRLYIAFHVQPHYKN